MQIKGEETLTKHYDALGDMQNDFRNLNLFLLVASMVGGNTVVDIGCGAAFFARILKASGKRVIGIEPSNHMRSLASRANPDVKVIAGRAEEVNTLLHEPVDSVVMIDVLEHIEEDVEQIKKVWFVLKEGGEFVFVVPAHPFLYGKRDVGMGHYRRYSKEPLRKMLTDNGFDVQYMRYWNVLGVIPYFISERILRKPLQTRLRKNGEIGMLARMAQRGLHLWFSQIESRFDFRFGLSIVGIARKTSI